MVSLLKAWWGDAATADNDFCFDYLPRLTGSHSTYETVMAQIDGHLQGLLPARAEPGGRLGQRADAADGHGQPGLAGGPRPRADRERHVLEGRPGDRDRGDAHRGHRDRGVLPARPPRTPRRAAASPTPSGCCSGTTPRSSRPGTRAATCGSSTTWAAGSGRSWPAPADEMDRPVLDLPGTTRPRAASTSRTPRRSWPRSTAGTRTASRCRLQPAQGRRLHRLRLLDLLRGLRRRGEPGRPAQAGPGSRTGSPPSGAGPGRPTGGSSTTGPRPTRTASRGASARRWCGGTPRSGKWTGHDMPDFVADRPPCLPAAGRRHRGGRASPAPTRSSCRPTARRGCTPRPGWSTGRCRRTTSRRSRRCPTCSTASSTTRSGRSSPTRRTGTSPAATSRDRRCSRTWPPPTG